MLTCESLEPRTLLSSDPITPPAPVPAETVQLLQPLTITGSTADAQQSKLWLHDNTWWSVMADSGTAGTAGSSGTFLWRLDGTTWTKVTRLTSAKYRADVSQVGDVVHVLLFGGDQARLVSLEYVPPAAGIPGTYQPWSQRLQSSPISLAAPPPAGTASVVSTATIDVDCQGRMWLASDGPDDIEVRYSDSPYTTWSQPIVLASGVGMLDDSVVTALPKCQVGVFWSNQITKRFGFRLHSDGADPAAWTADEVPASQSAQNDGKGMANQNFHVAVGPDGTLYAAVKTGHKSPDLPVIGLLVRRPSGTWDPMYDVDHLGSRPIVVLNENLGRLLVAYTATDLPGFIVYKESSTFQIGFGEQKTLLAGSFNDATSAKQNWTDSLVILASGGGSVAGATVNPTATNHAPQVDAGADQRLSMVDSLTLSGTVQDDGLPAPPGRVTTRWSQVSGPGTVTFADASAAATTATFSKAGSYVLRLDAGDGLMAAGDEVTITVTPPPNHPPQVEIRADQAIFLSGTAKLHGIVRDDGLPDPPGQTTTAWLAMNGPGEVTFADPFARDTTASFSAEGTYLLWFGASDGDLTASTEVTITVTQPPNLPPQVDAGPDLNVLVSKPIDLMGSVHDDGLPKLPGKVTNMWIKMSGPGSVSFRDATAPHTTATFSAEGTYVLRLEADDGDQSANDEVTITATVPVNLAPQVNAGADQTASILKPVNLNGTVQDDGLPKAPAKLASTWTKLSGPGTVSFVNAALPRTSATFSMDGTYVLRLEVNDGALTTSDDVTITVTPPPVNLPPQVNAGPDQMVAVAKPLTLNGTVQDDGLPKPPGKVTSTWTKVSGPGTVKFTKATSPMATVTFSVPGTYVLRLDASDGASKAGDEVKVTVVAAGVNLPPRVNAGPDQSVVVLKSASLSATVQDDGLPTPAKLTTAWSMVSGPGTVTFGKAAMLKTTAVFNTPGSYVLRLTANDGALAGSADVMFTVLPPPPNQAPQVNAGLDQALIATMATTLRGTVRDDGLPVPPAKVTTAWSLVSGPGTATFANPSAAGTGVTFSAPGTYDLRLDSNDGELAASDEVVITVTAATNLAPQVNAGPDLTVLLSTGEALHGTVSDDGLPQPPGKVTAAWSTVSGPGKVTFKSAATADTTAKFSALGTYVLRLTADDGLVRATDDVLINVVQTLPPGVLAMLGVRQAPKSDKVDSLLASGDLAELLFRV